MRATALDLPVVRVGEPLRHEALAVFPLFHDAPSEVAYRLAADALEDGTAVVEEISEEGSVPDVVVDNRGEVRVLFLEGEELVGAKQDRIVNTSVFVPAGAQIHIPVSCVEHGRWVYRSERLMASGVHSPTIVRSVLKASVSDSLREERPAVANQALVWDSVAKLHASYAVASPTGAMSDAFGQYATRIAEYRERLRYVPDARGLALAVGNRITALDIFDRAATCEQVWDRLLSGAVFDATTAPERESGIGDWDVLAMLETAREAPWERVRTIGDGIEYRGLVDGDPASVLLCEGVVIHESIVAA
jgi:hypothetical protein